MENKHKRTNLKTERHNYMVANFRDVPSGCQCCNARLTAPYIAYIQLHLQVPQFCHYRDQNPKYFQKGLFQIALSASHSPCGQVGQNYSLISAWPTSHFQSMKVTVCDSCPSCSAFTAETQAYARTRRANSRSSVAISFHIQILFFTIKYQVFFI